MLDSKKNLFKNTFLLYILLASKYVFQLVALAYLTRVLGDSGYGNLMFATAYIAYFQLFIDFGFLLSATREISINRDNRLKISQILGSTIIAKMFLAAIGSFILIITILIIPKIQENALILSLMYLNIILSIALPDYLFRGLEIMKPITIRVLISQTIVTILLFFLIKSPKDLILYPLLNIFGNIISIIWTWIYLYKTLKIIPTFSGFNSYKNALKTSLPFFTSRISSSLFGPTNIFLLGFKVSDAQLGLFGAANSTINAAKSMYAPLSDSLYPYMSSKKNFRLMKKLIIFATPFILIAASFCYINAEQILKTIGGQAYISASIYFRALIPSLVLSFYSIMLGFPTLGAMGRIREANLSIIIVSLVHFFILLWLFVIDKFTILNVCYLICATEALLVSIRAFWIFRPLKDKSNK